MRKAIPFFLIFIAANSGAADFGFSEKSPADRHYAENYQGIDKAKESQRFVFDPNKKIPEAERRYEELLAQKWQEEKKQQEWNNWNKDKCDKGFIDFGCPGKPSFLYDPKKMQEMLEQVNK